MKLSRRGSGSESIVTPVRDRATDGEESRDTGHGDPGASRSVRESMTDTTLLPRASDEQAHDRARDRSLRRELRVVRSLGEGPVEEVKRFLVLMREIGHVVTGFRGDARDDDAFAAR